MTTIFVVGDKVQFNRELATAWMPVGKTFIVVKVGEWDFPKLSKHPQKIYLDGTDFAYVSGHLLERVNESSSQAEENRDPDRHMPPLQA